MSLSKGGSDSHPELVEGSKVKQGGSVFGVFEPATPVAGRCPHLPAFYLAEFSSKSF